MVFKVIIEPLVGRISGRSDCQKFKEELLLTILAWIKLRLPNEVFLSIFEECPAWVEFVFNELKMGDEDSSETAAKVIVELVSLARSNQRLSCILDKVQQFVPILL